jgi:hypothetical protein
MVQTFSVPAPRHPMPFCHTRSVIVTFLLAACCLFANAASTKEPPSKFVPLFRDEGSPKGWLVRRWDDVSKSPQEPTEWTVNQGILQGSRERGTWLMSEREYRDFLLEFEFKLGPRGNSGVALRSPLTGDPAFDGIELQMTDVRYNPDATESELTGSLYRAVAPRRQVYKPTEWNRYEITLKGSYLRVRLNGELVQDLDLNREQQVAKRHDGTSAPPLKDRPRSGHIGFQELSRGGSHVQIRTARIKALN